MVVAPETVRSEITLTVYGSAKLSSPDDEGVVEESALFEIGDKGCRGLIGFLTTLRQLLGEPTVSIPATVEKLHEANPTFTEPTGHESVVSIGAGLASILPVKLESAVGLAGDVGEFGHRHLHAVGHLILCDTSFDFRIVEFLMMDAIECADLIERFTTKIGGDAVGIIEVENGILSRAEADALMFRGKETCAPESVVESLTGTIRGHSDKGGEVGIFATEPVGKPGTD